MIAVVEHLRKILDAQLPCVRFSTADEGKCKGILSASRKPFPVAGIPEFDVQRPGCCHELRRVVMQQSGSDRSTCVLAASDKRNNSPHI